MQKELISLENTQNGNYNLSQFTLFIQVTGVIGWRESNFVTLAWPALTECVTKVNFQERIKLIWCRSVTSDKFVFFKDNGAHLWQK